MASSGDPRKLTPEESETTVALKPSGPRKTAREEVPQTIIVTNTECLFSFSADILNWNNKQYPRMKHVRPYFPAVAYLPIVNVIIVAGGFFHDALSSAETLDLKTKIWSDQPSMIVPRFNTAGVCLTDGVTFLVCGGLNDKKLSSCEQFNAQTRVWSSVADMSIPRYSHAMVLYQGTPVVLGGAPEDALTTAEQYNSSTNTWSSFPAFNTPHHDPRAAVVFDKIYIVGVGKGGRTLSVEMYDGATWSGLRDLPPGPRFGHAVVCFQDKLVVFGGGNKEVDAYDPVNHTWIKSLYPPFDFHLSDVIAAVVV